MKLFTISDKKLTRYYLNPSLLSIFFSLYSSPKTLIPSSLTPLNIIFRSNQLHTSSSSCNLSTGSLPNSFIKLPIYRFTSSHQFPIYVIDLLRPRCLARCFYNFPSNGNCPLESVEFVAHEKKAEFEEMGNDFWDDSEFRKCTVEGFESNVNHKNVSEIIAAVRSGDSDLSSKLSLVGINRSVRSITEIFRVLNRDKIPALHFFQWVQRNNPELCYSCYVCSLIIDNCGWLEDYGTMIVILKKFRLERICLTEKAFEFLSALISSKVSTMEAIRRVVKLLNEVGGSCHGSGICSLIKMLCTLDAFEMAKFVIEITEGNTSYYNIIICEKLRRGHSVKVHGVLEEMRELGCHPNVKTYNYLLSNLCKNDRMSEACSVVELMEENGESPDELTFEILIHYYCRLGKMDITHQFIDRMMSRDLEPRLQTHVAFVKSYFHAGNYKEAHKYEHNLDNRFLKSINMIYSLLANLHQKKGNLIVARNILIEMMEKDLKPNFLVYIKIMKRLRKTGKRSLAGDLKSRFSRFTMEVSTTTG